MMPNRMNNCLGLKPVGKCFVCGKNLAVGIICFDCNDSSLSNQELKNTIFTAQRHSLVNEGKCLIKPEEGDDYAVEHEVILHLSATGDVVVYADVEDGDYADKIEYKHVEWLDVDVVDVTVLNGKRRMTFDGYPFNETEWLMKKLGMMNRDNAMPENQMKLNEFGCNQS